MKKGILPMSKPSMFKKFKDRPGLIKKGLAMKQHIQDDVGIDQNFHFRYLLNRSERSSSRLMSPAWAAIPSSWSESGVGCFLLTGLASTGITGAGVKASMALPAGIFRGTSIISRYVYGLFYGHRALLGFKYSMKRGGE
ncbi:MAG: hypothetical protein LBC31_04540 [Treponema sp.]|jgi:hypothetical protein|nr:hypothetical protein [Treponema sp.]